MPLVAPVFLQTDQIDSSITVVNSIIWAVNGTITLRDQQGNVVGQQTLTFPPHSSTPVAMKTILAATGSQAHSGSVTLEQDPAIRGPALLSQLSMTLHAGSQPSFLEEEFGMPTPYESAVLQAVASQTINLPLIAITSLSEAAQTISASCVGENAKPANIELPAYGTALVQACSWQGINDNSLSLSSSLLSSGGSTQSDHAISLKTDSVPGSFYAFGFALNGGLDQPQLQPVDFYDPGLLASTSIVYVGVPIGASPAFGAVLSSPVITLANFSSQPRQTTVTLSDSSSGSPKLATVATLTLPPFTTTTTTLPTTGTSGSLNSFTINSNGKPGDVQAHLFTRVGTSEQRAELLAKDARDDHNGGDHPWSIANGDTSTLLLYNTTAQPLQFQVHISGAGNSWLQTFHLAPYETRAVSINDIVVKGTADYKGAKLPTDLTAGEVQWSTEYGATGLGRLLVTNTTSSLARSFSCQQYDNICGATFGDNNFQDIMINDDGTLSNVTPNFCVEYSPTSCTNQTPTYSGTPYTTTWSGGNSSYTSVIGSSNYSIQLKGISVGQFAVSAVTEAGYCQSAPMGGGGSVAPTVTVVSADITTDQITVQLAAGNSTTAGPLEVEIDGPNVVDQPQNGGNYTSGSYTFNFNQNTLGSYPGQYNTVKATWTVGGQQYVGSLSYSFDVLGIYRQTQYNTPAESSCSGGPTPISVFSAGYPSCPYVNTTVISGFDFQVTNPAGGTGSGHSINFGDVQQEASCSVGSGDLRGHVTIRGSLGGLGNNTVAACPSSQIYSPNVQVYIRGEGVKTVTDACAACCADANAAHLDNYTTNTACSGVPSLPSALTVQLQ